MILILCGCVTAQTWITDRIVGVELMFLTTVLNVFMKLYHCCLLLFCLNGPFSKSSDFFDGFQTWDVPCFHQVAGQHGPRPAMTMHAVNCNGLRNTENQNQLLSGWRQFMKTLQILLTFNITVPQTDKMCLCVCVCVYIYIYIYRERERESTDLVLIWK